MCPIAPGMAPEPLLCAAMAGFAGDTFSDRKACERFIGRDGLEWRMTDCAGNAARRLAVCPAASSLHRVPELDAVGAYRKASRVGQPRSSRSRRTSSRNRPDARSRAPHSTVPPGPRRANRNLSGKGSAIMAAATGRSRSVEIILNPNRVGRCCPLRPIEAARIQRRSRSIGRPPDPPG